LKKKVDNPNQSILLGLNSIHVLNAPSLAQALDLPLKQIKVPINLNCRNRSPFIAHTKMLDSLSPKRVRRITKSPEPTNKTQTKVRATLLEEEASNIEAFQIFQPYQKQLKRSDHVLRGFKRKWRKDEMNPDLDKPKVRFQNNLNTLNPFASSSNVFFTDAEKKNRGVVLEMLRMFNRA
jgi:hypothetical protein